LSQEAVDQQTQKQLSKQSKAEIEVSKGH